MSKTATSGRAGRRLAARPPDQWSIPFTSAHPSGFWFSYATLNVLVAGCCRSSSAGRHPPQPEVSRMHARQHRSFTGTWYSRSAPFAPFNPLDAARLRSQVAGARSVAIAGQVYSGLLEVHQGRPHADRRHPNGHYADMARIARSGGRAARAHRGRPAQPWAAELPAPWRVGRRDRAGGPGRTRNVRDAARDTACLCMT